MASGNDKLAQQIERLPLDAALKSAVLEGVENTDDETAELEAASLRAVLDRIPGRRRAIRKALREEKRATVALSIARIERSARDRFDTPERVAAMSEGAMTSGNIAFASGGFCPTCGQRTSNLEQLLGRLGISDEMINNLRTQMQNVDVEEYLDTARDYLKASSENAKTFTKENPGKVAAGIAVLCVGAGLLISALNRE